MSKPPSRETPRAWIWRAVSSEAQMAEDKISLEEQEAACREWCARNKVQVAGVLTVPGLSRSESDVFDLFEEYASKGIYAYHDLRKLWKARSFDYLVVYVLNRLGRSSSLYSYAMENTVRAGATIVSVTEGIRVDDSNVELMLPMGSFASTSEIKNLKLRRKMGMKARAERGLKQANYTPFGFIEERDANGKALRMMPDPAMRRLLDDAAALLLEGVPYLKMEREAFDRFGHGRDGKPYPPATFHYMFFSPATWGNTAQNHRNPKTPNGQSFAAWAYNAAAPPSGVIFYANTHQPLYVEPLAGRVKAELTRRSQLRGNARPRTTPAFSGLLVCEGCGWYLAANASGSHYSDHAYWFWRCETTRRKVAGVCPEVKYISDRAVQAYFHQALRVMLETNDLGEFDPRRHRLVDDRRPAIQAEIDKLDGEMRRLVRALRSMPAENPAWAMLNDSLANLGEQRQRLDHAYREAEREAVPDDPREQFAALDEIRRLSLESFWEQPSFVINQMLRRLFGPYRVSISDGQFKHVVIAPADNRARANRNRVR